MDAKAGATRGGRLAGANRDANPELMRLGLKCATGAGETTVMAMLIAWQSINAARRPGSKRPEVRVLSPRPFGSRVWAQRYDDPRDSQERPSEGPIPGTAALALHFDGSGGGRLGTVRRRSGHRGSPLAAP